MDKITENEIELYTIELLEKLGFEYVYAPSIAPDSETPMRASFEDVILKEKLLSSLIAINPTLDYALIEDAIKQIGRIKSSELLTDNETFHKLLTEGVKVETTEDGVTRGEIVNMIDFDDVSNNDFVVSNQFTIVENGINRRPDLLLFVNGLPLVVVELKNAVDENATVKSAYKQIQTYKETIPSLFTYNAFCVVSDGIEAKAGTISAGFSRFMSWKSSDGKSEASKLVPQVETLIEGMLNPTTLLDLVRSFIVFEKDKKEDSKTGITMIETVKKLAAYHQYYAVNKAVESTLRAVGNRYVDKIEEPPSSYGLSDVKDQPEGDGKAGVVWHTQGSGKSLSMVFYTGKIVLALDNPTVLVITDRNDLDDQLFDTFAASQSLLRQEPIQAGISVSS
jgi:type I restriction enzyme R subunit